MARIDILVDSLQHLATPENMLIIAIGVTLGIVFGSIPGFTGSNTVAIFLPFTLPLEPDIAIVFLSCIYVGANYGGAIPAVLINTPGTAGATATVMDAYPMSKQGTPSKALGISILASVFGGLFSGIIIFLVLAPFGEFALQFANREIFVLGLFGLATVAVALGEDTRKGIIAGFFGLFISTWPTDPTTAQTRMDFGLDPLLSQIPFIPVVIGVFAITELFYLANQSQISEGTDINTTYSGIIEGFVYVINHPLKVAKATSIGLVIGSMPGAGASVGGFVSWATAKSMSSDSDSFGKGNPDGVIASESANNAVTSGALIPTLTLGIPGSGTTAVMLAGLLLHGIRPGPTLMQDFAFEVNVIVVSLVFANLFMLIVAFAISKYIVRVVTFPTKYLVPSILVLTAIGAFVIRNQPFDIMFMALFGFVGLLMKENGYAIIPLILGVILGPIIEGSFLRSMLISGGDYGYFFESTIAIVLWILTFLVLFTRPLVGLFRTQVRPRFGGET